MKCFAMKKIYEKPKMEVIEIDICTMFATSCYIDENSPGDFKEDFNNKRRRGTWGNLWEKH